MKKIHTTALSIFISVALLLSLAPTLTIALDSTIDQATAYETSLMSAEGYVPGEFLVSVQADAENHDVFQPLHVLGDAIVSIERVTYFQETDPTLSDIYLLKVDSSRECEALLILQQISEITSITPNYVSEFEDVEIRETASIENNSVDPTVIAETDQYDPLEQWALDKIGVGDAWASGFVGSNEILVGILDSGISPHTDLDNRLCMELAYNAEDESTDVTDIAGHGTFVAGIIGATLNNSGVVGVCQNIKLVPIKLGDSTYTLLTIIRAVQYATDNNIDIINLSGKIWYGSDVINTTIRNVVAGFGGLFVTTAGNDGADMSSVFTAAGKCHNDPLWIVVGSTTETDARSATSNYSSQYCDLFAPGDDIVSTTLSNGYTTDSGTSFAAPYVTAAAALIMSHAPHLTPYQLKALIINTVDTFAALDNLCVSEGRLSIINAVNYLYSENRGAYTLGDVTGDGYITSDDASIIQQIALDTYTPSASQLLAADIDGNGVIETKDYLKVARYVQKTYYFSPV